LTEQAEELVAAHEEVVPPEAKPNGEDESSNQRSPAETAISRLVKVNQREMPPPSGKV
jgi:hypothetical protein